MHHALIVQVSVDGLYAGMKPSLAKFDNTPTTDRLRLIMRLILFYVSHLRRSS